MFSPWFFSYFNKINTAGQVLFREKAGIPLNAVCPGAFFS
jgi:hypothetical protein